MFSKKKFEIQTGIFIKLLIKGFSPKWSGFLVRITCQNAILVHFLIVRVRDFGPDSKNKSGPKSHFRNKSIT